MSQQSIDYRPDIDGLRAVAVMSVVLCHARLGLTGGFVGVDVFFVISGYLIATLIRKEQQANAFSLSDFWMRRIRRLVPALMMVVTVTLAAGWLWLVPEDFANLGRSVKSLLLLRPNIHFMFATGYFEPAAAAKPLLHTWSLGVEEQFYLVVPFAMLLLARVRKTTRQIALLTLTLTASLAACVIGTHWYPVSAFYLMPARAWEFLAGMLLAYCPLALTMGRSTVRELAALAGLAAILIPAWFYDEKSLFPGYRAIPPVLGAVLLIWAGNCSGGLPLANRLLASRPLVGIGLISYSVYLWHWPLIVFVQYRTLMPLETVERAGLAAASLALGAASWRFVELPFRHKRLLATRPRLLAGVALACVPIYVTAVTVYHANGYEDRIPEEARLFARTSAREKGWDRIMRTGDIPDKMICFGDPSPAPSLLVWGDSFAGVTAPAIESWCQKTGIPARLAYRPGTCPLMDFVPPVIIAEPSRVSFLRFNHVMLEHIRTVRYANVLLIANWGEYMDAPETTEALLRTVDHLQSLGARVWFMRAVPNYPYDIPRSLFRCAATGRNLRQLALSAADLEEQDRTYDTLRPRLLERGVTFLDPIPYLRSAEDPSLMLPYDSRGSFYVDSMHLSRHGAMTIEPMFAPLFESMRKSSP